MCPYIPPKPIPAAPGCDGLAEDLLTRRLALVREDYALFERKRAEAQEKRDRYSARMGELAREASNINWALAQLEDAHRRDRTGR